MTWNAGLMSLGEDVGDQAVLRLVCRRDRLVVGLEGLDRRDRSEDLLAEQLGVVGEMPDRTVGA